MNEAFYEVIEFSSYFIPVFPLLLFYYLNCCPHVAIGTSWSFGEWLNFLVLRLCSGYDLSSTPAYITRIKTEAFMKPFVEYKHYILQN